MTAKLFPRVRPTAGAWNSEPSARLLAEAYFDDLSPAASPPITYVASAVASDSDTCSIPSGVVAGDVLVAALYTNGAITGPAGWVQQQQAVYGGAYLTVFTRIAGASEPPSYTWTPDPFVGFTTIGISAYRGVDPTTPITGTPTQASAGASSVVVGSITTAVPDALLIKAGQGYISAPPLTWTGGGTTRWEDSSSGVFLTSETDEQLTSAGATGSRTATLTNPGGSPWTLGVMLALNPAVSSGATGTVSAGDTAASGVAVTATAGTGVTGSVAVGNATASGLSVTAIAGTGASGAITAGTATATGLSVTAIAGVGVTGSVTAGTSTTSGLSVSATGGVSATGSVAGGDAAAIGLSVTADAGTGGNVAAGTAATSGLTVNALAGSASIATVTAGDGTAAGTLVIATAGVAAAGSVNAGAIVASGWLITSGTGVSATIEPATIVADGGEVTVLMLPSVRLSATLSHHPALSATLTAHGALTATTSHHPALSAACWSIVALSATLGHHEAIRARLEHT